MMKKFNTFHFVTMSPWPVLSSIQAQSFMLIILLSLSKKANKASLLLNLFMMLATSLMWWKNTLIESNKEGLHLNKTIKGLKLSMILFISSEILFFVSFFWAYFHNMSSPNIQIGHKWPPLSISSFNPINVPLLNTMILISSGFSITWAHHSMMEGNWKKSTTLMIITCLLGAYFTTLQKMEYDQAQFCLNDSSYGTTFFMATGFHGLHVIIGSTFLMTNYMFMKNLLINKKRHLGFEMAAWYWHFVDIIWLMLYLSFYWWGN